MKWLIHWTSDPRRSTYLILALVIAAGATLRAWTLGDDPLWGDEALSYVIAHYRVSEVFFQPVDPTPGLYYAIQRLWMDAGLSPLALRIPSFVFGVSTIAAMYWLGSEAAGRKAGLWAAVLTAVMPEFVDYSREARCYALLVLLLTLASACVIKAHKKDEARPLLFLLCSLLFAVAAIYTHVVAWFFLSPIALAIVFHSWRTNRIPLRLVFATGVLAAVLVLPEVRRAYLFSGYELFAWLEQLSALNLITLLVGLAGPSPTFHAHTGLVIVGGAVSPIFWAVLQGLTIAFYAWVALLLVRSASSIDRMTRYVLASIIFAYPLLAHAFGNITPVLMPRTLMPWQAGIVLAAGIGLSRMRHHLVVGSLLALSLIAEMTAFGFGRDKNDWKAVAKIVHEDDRTDAVVMCAAWASSALTMALADLEPEGQGKPILIRYAGQMVQISNDTTRYRDLATRYFETVWSRRAGQERVFARKAVPDRLLPRDVIVIDRNCSDQQMETITQRYEKIEDLAGPEGSKLPVLYRARLKS